MTDPAITSESGPAPSISTAPPPLLLPGVAASRIIIDAIQPTITEIRGEIRSAEDKTDSHFKWLLVAYGAGFLALAGMFISGYLILDEKLDNQNIQVNSTIDSNYKDLDNKIQSSQESLVQVSTQLSDLLERIPPEVQPIPSK